jgi:hypothetical protein
MWTRKDFEDAAAQIGNTYLENPEGTSLNEIASKVASDNGLNPEEIRSLVRLANVHTFEQAFSKMATKDDRMVDYEVGDADKVVSMLDGSAVIKVAEYKEVSSDYDFSSDYYGSLADPELEKVAEEVVDEMPAKKELPISEQRRQYKEAIAELSMRAGIKEAEWTADMEGCLRLMKSTVRDEYDLSCLEKEVLASSNGEKLAEHLRTLHDKFTRGRSPFQWDSREKIAQLQNSYVSRGKFKEIRERLVKAAEAAEEVMCFARASEHLTKSLQELSQRG